MIGFLCISRFVPFLARRARFRLALCRPGRFFGVFVSWKHSWRSEQVTPPHVK